MFYQLKLNLARLSLTLVLTYCVINKVANTWNALKTKLAIANPVRHKFDWNRERRERDYVSKWKSEGVSKWGSRWERESEITIFKITKLNISVSNKCLFNCPKKRFLVAFLTILIECLIE